MEDAYFHELKAKNRNLSYFLTQPGRSECGVQLARGFPPRSKWTYGEVFHPAVVPQPPFYLAFAFTDRIYKICSI